MKSLEDLRLDDFRLELKGRSLVPIMQGGMGVNISTAEMAQAVAARGGIGHVSDAMVPDLADRLFGTGFTRMKALACKALERTTGEAGFHFPVEKIREAAKLYLARHLHEAAARDGGQDGRGANSRQHHGEAHDERLARNPEGPPSRGA